MRGSDLNHLPLSFVLGWPALILCVVGLSAIAIAIGVGAWWVLSHLQWVTP